MKQRASTNLFTFFTLYIAQSIPMSFFATALPVLMRQGDYSLFVIALLKLIKLPWILKCLWSPLVDCRTETVADYKRWIIGAEIVYALLIFVVAMLRIDTHFTLIDYRFFMAINKLYRIFYSDDMPCSVFIAVIYHRGEGGRLSRASRTYH